jgi:aromatic-L-amino-acid decarboxylase
MDWFAELLALPDAFLHGSESGGGGVIVGTASDAVLIAMLAARDRARDAGHEPVVYASSQAHSSVMKAAMIAGIARHAEDVSRVRMIDIDAEFRMDVRALARAMQADDESGFAPAFVCATVGTTGVTAIDPVASIADVTMRHGAWLHIDAAYAGSACVCPEFRPWLDGIARADSLSVNPHKWLLTNFDCGCLWVRDRAPVLRALSVTPEYLRNRASEASGVVDFRDWHVPLGRRFRALKLWFVLRYYGKAGLQAYIRSGIAWAKLAREWVEADGRLQVMAPQTMNLLCLRTRGLDADERTRRVMERVNESGRAFLSHTKLPTGEFVLRWVVGGSARATGDHVRDVWLALQEAMDTVH